jgi:hypothetical protein
MGFTHKFGSKASPINLADLDTNFSEAANADFSPVITYNAGTVGDSLKSLAAQVNGIQQGPYDESQLTGIRLQSINMQTGQSYTLVAADAVHTIVERNSTVPNDTLLPSTSVIAVGSPPIPIVQLGTGVSSIKGVNASITLLLPTGSINQIARRNVKAFVEPIATDTWLLSGELATSALPTWTVDPSISGTGVVGANLTCNDGTYTANASVSRQWLVAGAITGNTGAAYAPVANDVGKTAACQVTITLNGVSATKTTNSINIVAAAETKPQNTTLPSITGTNTVGSNVSLNVGVWTNNPTGTPGYSLTLKRDGTTTQAYTLNANTTSLQYTLVTLDAATALTLSVTATNNSGTGNAAVSAPFAVAGLKPQYSGGASITPASPVVGAILTANQGSVTGATSMSYVWSRGATQIQTGASNQYTSVQADVNQTISCVITATNSAGSIDITPSGVVVLAQSGGNVPVYFDNGVAATGTTLFSGSIAVSPRLVGMHWIQFTDSYGQPHYGPFNPAWPANEAIKLTCWRTHGNHEIGFWNMTEPTQNASGASNGYDWSHWDKAESFFAHNNINNVYIVLQGIPSFYRARPLGPDADWGTQLPTSQTAMNNYLNALFTRYPRLFMVEVANEFWTSAAMGNTTGAISEGVVYNGSWVGTMAELRTLCSWILDWRNNFNNANPGRNIKVQAPSVPGEAGHAQGLINFLNSYSRKNEFDSFSGHEYEHYENDMQGTNLALSMIRSYVNNNITNGTSKPVRDGEHGLANGVTVSAARIYNMFVRAAIMGIDGIDFFTYGGLASSDYNAGMPFQDASVRQAYADAASLCGTTITKVMSGPGGYWRVEGLTAASGGGSGGGGGGGGGAAPSFISASKISYGTSATATANVPAGSTNGERLVLVVALLDSTKTITNPSGWGSPVSSQTSGSGATHVRTQIYERVASSEPASYSITLSGSCSWAASICRLAATGSTPSEDASPASTSGEGANPTAPSVTAVSASTLLLAVAAQYQATGTTWGQGPAGWSLDAYSWQSMPINLAIMHKAQSVAGATGTVAFSADGFAGTYWTAHQIAYKS